MDKRGLIVWINCVGIIGVLFGIFYAFFGLESLPVYKIFVPTGVYKAWSSGLYGSTFIGFSVLLLLVGRHAFTTNDKVLMRALLYGVMSWLIVEGFFSFYYGIYINVAVDVALTLFLGWPIMIAMRARG